MMTREQAISCYEMNVWAMLTVRQRVELQMAEDRLCMPLTVFHKAISDILGRPVYTHELGLNREGLAAELDRKTT